MYKNTHFILVHILPEKCLEMLREGEKIKEKIFTRGDHPDLGAVGGGGVPRQKCLQFITR